ncbi:ribosomal protein bL12 [Candidatus Vidania fulgoroideorum]
MKVKKIFELICNLNLTKAYKLLLMLEKKFKFSNTITEEKTQNIKKSFKIILKELGASKIMIIKLVKEITNLDLMSSKKIIDKLPCEIKSDLSKEDAEQIKNKFDKLGCVAEIL